MYSRINNKTTRALWVIIPPIFLSLFTFLFFFGWYKNLDPRIDISNTQQDFTEINFKQTQMRKALPNYINNNLSFVVCLHNNNQIYIEGELFDNISLSDSEERVWKGGGAMAVHSSLIPDLELYKVRGDSGCVPIDFEKIANSKVTLETNVGLVSIFDEIDVNNLNSGMSVEKKLETTFVDTSKSYLYVRMYGFSILIISIGWLVVWFGFVLLLGNIVNFIRGRDQ